MLPFTPLYFADRLHTINIYGDVGVVTLWTPVQQAISCLARLNIDLDVRSSRIAVLGNLYGDGLPHMICNLLWNPQIQHLLIFGQDLSGSAEELVNLLTLGTEPIFQLGCMRLRIKGTSRTIDTHLGSTLLGRVRPILLGQLSLSTTLDSIRVYFDTLPTFVLTQQGRVHISLQEEYSPTWFPSEPRGHVIICHKPLEAWESVVRRVLRFGVPLYAGKGKQRLELQNLKVVITSPVEDDINDLCAVGFNLTKLHGYQTAILSDERPEDVSYTYNCRLRFHWGKDQIKAAAARLSADHGSRDAFLVLWDPGTDLEIISNSATPCLTTLFFRVFQDTLTLTATFRVHNVMSAWLQNLYGLIAIQLEVSRLAGNIPPGAITVISHSITIDPDIPERLGLAQSITTTRKIESRKTTGDHCLRADPNGYFSFAFDRDTKEIVAIHKSDGITLTCYRGHTAEEVERQIVYDHAISDIGHAMYVGRQLAYLENEVKFKRI